MDSWQLKKLVEEYFDLNSIGIWHDGLLWQSTEYEMTRKASHYAIIKSISISNNLYQIIYSNVELNIESISRIKC